RNRFRLDVSAHLLAVDLVREADDDEPPFELGPTGEDPALEGQRAELVAVTDDDLLATARHEEDRHAAVESVGPLVSRMEPAVRAEHPSRRLVVPQVREHRAVTAHAELAGRSLSDRPSGIVHDPDVGPRERAPDGRKRAAVEQLASLLGVEVCADAAREVRV